MPNRKVRHPGAGHSGRMCDPNRDAAYSNANNLTQLSRELGSCVYFIRCDDGAIKIGTTTHIANRKRAFGSGWERILAVIPGDRDDEHNLHVKFAHHLIRGREYFAPDAEIIDHINAIRVRLGVSRLAA